MAVSFNKEVISKAIQEVLAEKTIIASKAKKMQQQQDVAKDPSIPSSVKPAVKKALDQATDGEEIEVPTNETLSVGHVDDEPGMLKQFAFDTAEYAAKLYKLLHHYEQMEDHVDFPNWWQHKVMMAREYMSKATHYLEFETMKPQIDAAVDGHSEDRVNEQAESLQAVTQKVEQKLQALGLQTKVFEGEFEVPKNARDMIAKNNKLGALAYSRDKSIFAGHPESERLEVVVHKDHLEDLKKIASEFKMPSGSVQAFAGTDFVRLRHTADVVDESVELDEARDYQALVGKTVQYGGRRATVEGEEGDYIRLKFEDGKENLVSKSDFENKEPYVNEDDDVEPSKKDIKAAEKETGVKKTHFTPEAQNMHNIIKNKVTKIEKKVEAGDDYKLDLAALKQYISKPEVRKALGAKHIKGMVSSIISERITEGVSCCGRCGRVHESAQDCKKPYISKDSPRHCKNKK